MTSEYIFGIIHQVNNILHGGVAQLGERLNGIQEVIGSIPTVSTKNPVFERGWDFTFYFFTLHSSLPIHFSLFLTVDFRKIIRYTVKTEERYFFRTSVFILLIFREGKNKNCARIVSEAVCFGQLVSVLSRQRTTHIFRRTLCR